MDKGFLSNASGGKSLVRLVNAFVVVVVMLNWTYINIVTQELTPIGGTNLALIVAVLTGKVFEKHLENENGKSKASGNQGIPEHP